MWKRDQALKPVNGQPAAPAVAPYEPPAPMPVAAPVSVPSQMGRDIVNIGKSVVIKGELNGSEDLTIEGRVEGTIDLRENVLTIGPNGKIKAQVFARIVVVLGAVTGNITASEKIDIRDGGTVEGDLVSPRVGISEGAHFRGTVDMQKKQQPLQAVPQRPGVQDKPSQPADLAAKRPDVPAAPAFAH
jgi:cytoskeletal protein CcmA (bactofilin family)